MGELVNIHKFIQLQVDNWCEKRKLSKAEFYALIGMSQSGFRQAMVRESVDIRLLLRIAHALNVDWKELLPLGDSLQEPLVPYRDRLGAIEDRLEELRRLLLKAL